MQNQSSGAVRKSRWPSCAFRPNEPYGFCGTLSNTVTELCLGIGHSLSLICQPTSEDMKLYIIIMQNHSVGDSVASGVVSLFSHLLGISVPRQYLFGDELPVLLNALGCRSKWRQHGVKHI